MSQQDNSRAAVERLVDELAATTDPAHAEALTSQIRLHAELAGMSLADVAALAGKLTESDKPAETAKPVKATKAAEG